MLPAPWWAAHIEVARAPEDWDWLLSCGVDGIISDDPDTLLLVAKRNGLR